MNSSVCIFNWLSPCRRSSITPGFSHAGKFRSKAAQTPPNLNALTCAVNLKKKKNFKNTGAVVLRLGSGTRRGFCLNETFFPTADFLENNFVSLRFFLSSFGALTLLVESSHLLIEKKKDNNIKDITWTLTRCFECVAVSDTQMHGDGLTVATSPWQLFTR